MPVHDWTRVEDAVFHDFHHIWISSIRRTLNSGLLPPEYYAMADQVAGPGNPDVLTLQRPRRDVPTPHVSSGGATVALAARQDLYRETAPGRRRQVRRPKRIAVRHVTGHRVVALIEIVSAGNKSSVQEIGRFGGKLAAFLDEGIHLMVLDLQPPGRRDPNGIHPVIWKPFGKTSFTLPAGQPFTLASYNAGPPPEAFVRAVGVGQRLPDMPLFLTPEECVSVPLETTYEAALNEVPPPWREVLDATVAG